MNRAKQFYGEGLGCAIEQEHPGFVSFNLGIGSSKLALYTWDALARDAGVPADGSGFRGITLNYIVPSPERVDEVMAQAERAGAQIVKPAQKAQWGGYSGHFSDPDGYLWKVAADAEQLSWQPDRRVLSSWPECAPPATYACGPQETNHHAAGRRCLPWLCGAARP